MPIWNDQRAQLDFYTWLERHQQERREEEIRELAKKYATGDMQRVALPFITNQGHGITASYPPSPTVNFRFNDIHLDIHPGVQGFARQLLAEMAIREQLDLGDEPGDT